MSNGTIVAMAVMGFGFAVVFYLAPSVLDGSGVQAAIPPYRRVAFVGAFLIVVVVAALVLIPFFSGAVVQRLIDPNCSPGMYMQGICDDSYYPNGRPPKSASRNGMSTDARERAWFGVHDRLLTGWRVGPAKRLMEIEERARAAYLHGAEAIRGGRSAGR